jgi:hypothetical protein
MLLARVQVLLVGARMAPLAIRKLAILQQNQGSNPCFQSWMRPVTLHEALRVDHGQVTSPSL